MKHLLAATARRNAKFRPRHFEMLADWVGGVEWIDTLADVSPGAWTLVIRGPGAYALGAASARTKGIACVFDQLTADERAALGEHDGRLLIDLGWEVVFPRADIVRSMLATVVDQGIDPARVFVLHSNQAARAVFEREWRSQTDMPVVRTLEYPVALALCVAHQQKTRDADAIAARRDAARRATQDGLRSDLFVCFNGEVRPHRLFFAASLEKAGLLERGNFSLLHQRKGVGQTEAEFRQGVLHGLAAYRGSDDIRDAAGTVLDRLPMTLDIPAVPAATLEDVAWSSPDPTYYDRSRFSIVLDTTIADPDMLFVTEKVVKSLVNHSPFMLIGNPGAADLLRDYGFETFEPFIAQPETRDVQAILPDAVREMIRLSALDEAGLDAMSHALQPICDRNADHYWGAFPARLKAQFCVDVLDPLHARPASAVSA